MQTNEVKEEEIKDKKIHFIHDENTKYKGLESLKNKIPNQAEEALRYRLRNFGSTMCSDFMKKFAQCTKNKTISVVYKCRDEHRELTECLNEIVNEPNLNQLRHAYINGDLMKKHSYEDWHAELNKRLDEKK